jgi:hypothetical protein
MAHAQVGVGSMLVVSVVLNPAMYGPPLIAALRDLSYFHATRVTLAASALSAVARAAPRSRWRRQISRS